MKLTAQAVLRILEKERLLSLATAGGKYPDNSVVCFAFDGDLRLYFGSYSDTLKCRNIVANPHVAATAGTLQIHGKAKIVPYGSDAYKKGRAVYDGRFPQYKDLFELEGNELYVIEPLAVWNYNTSLGEMNRDELILDEAYSRSIGPYRFHAYARRNP